MKEIMGTEIKSDEVSMQDIRRLCEEITSYSEQAHKRGNKNRIKPRYTKALKEVHDEYQTAVDNKDLAKLDKVLTKYRKVLDRYMKLQTEVDSLKVQDENNNISYRIGRTSKGSVKSLGSMFTYAKLGITNFVKEQKQSEREQKEYERKQEIYKNIGKSPYEIMKEEKKEREKAEFKKEVEQVETISTKFHAELLGHVQEENSESSMAWIDSNNTRDRSINQNEKVK